MAIEETLPLDQLDNSNNLDKYRKAGEIASAAMDVIVQNTKPGKSVIFLCQLGDKYIEKAVDKTYVNRNYKKGIAFPTNIGVNNCPGYYSPVDDNVVLKNGDLVNIELGVHIDGYPAILGYTVVINNTNVPIMGEKANLMHAVADASRTVLSLMTETHTNTEVVEFMGHVAKKYNCNLLYTDNPNLIAPGICSYQISRNVIDGYNDDNDDDYVHKVILNRNHENYDFSMRKSNFEENEVYAIDITMTTGNGRLNYTDEKTTIFRKDFSKGRVNLTFKSAKYTISKFNQPFPVCTRDFLDSKIKMGVLECCKKGLLVPYAPYAVKAGEYVAKIKFTVVVKKKKSILITGRSIQEQLNKVKL